MARYGVLPGAAAPVGPGAQILGSYLKGRTFYAP